MSSHDFYLLFTRVLYHVIVNSNYRISGTKNSELCYDQFPLSKVSIRETREGNGSVWHWGNYRYLSRQLFPDFQCNCFGSLISKMLKWHRLVCVTSHYHNILCLIYNYCNTIFVSFWHVYLVWEGKIQLCYIPEWLERNE